MSLHANWDNAALHLWGDAPQDGVAPLPIDALRDAIAEASGDALLASVGEPSELRLRLPEKGVLVDVTVPTLRFAATEAVDLLIACCPAADAGACDDSIRYWATLARHVTQRIAAQQFFPDLLERRDGELEATWRLLVGSGEDIKRLEQFADAMPRVCRAIVTNDPRTIPADATALVESFLSRTSDGLIRRDVSHDPFFARVHELAAAEDAPAEVRWMSALLGNDRTVKIDDPYDARRLVEQVRAWVGRLEEQSAASPWQVEFVLEEPEEDQDGVEKPWNVALRLRPATEDAEPLSAAELWDERAETGAILGRKLAARREQVRADLALAAEVFPPLSSELQSESPTNVRLSTPEAHLFIRNWGPQLRERNFLVTLPQWTSARDLAPGLLLSISPIDDEQSLLMTGPPRQRAGGGPTSGEFNTGHFGLDSLLNFDWQIAVGDLRFSPDEFARLAQGRLPLVRHGGRWVQLDVEAADRAAQLLEKKKAGTMTLAEAFRTAFTTSAADGVPIVGLHGTSWVGQLLEQAPSARVTSLEQPAGFHGTLRPYQLRGLDWLSFLAQLGIGGCLADDMGLGKTIQLIALMLHERETGNGAPKLGPTLLFAPTSVVGNWTKELARFAMPLKVLVHHGPERLHGEPFVKAAGEHDVVITSYALAHRDVEDFRRVAWHRIALDEAQKIKNPYAAATQAIRSLSAPHRVALTGTPIENRLSELWSIMEVLNPGLLGSAAEFRDRFAMPIEKLVDQDRAGQLRRLIQPFVLRRTKSDPLIAGDLPEKMEMKVYCNLTPEQAAMYQQITSQMLGQVDAADGIRRRALVLAALTRLKQVCDHPGLLTDKNGDLDGRSGKTERLVEMLEEVIEEGDSALVFTQFREMGHLLEQILARRLRRTVPFLHGGTPAKMRDQMIDDFQKPGEGPKIFLLSLRAGGLGLNLTNANHVFHFDRWWNPAVESQATDRAHRIGQTRKVQVHKFVCIGTVEERIDQLLTEKVALADRIVGSGDEWLTNLSTDDLRKTLELSASAVAEY
ncbi:MAG TPA: DEAD/DEAH box helicase [Tepidisphaeraceae bacterium]|nr:DEAD/DEAH box helicase [Tepidisphaeraceae bacterium]